MEKERRAHARANGRCSLHSRDYFDYLLRCERARADRTNSEFALLSFRKEELIHHVGSLDEFVLCAQKRLRLTDQVGWLDAQSIGMLLPNTNLEGGLGCMSSFGRRHFKRAAGLTFSAQSYPRQRHILPGESSPGRSKSYVFTLNGNGSENGGAPVITEISEQPAAHGVSARMPRWKRVLDCVGASIGVLLGLPVCALVAAYVHLVSPGPVLFRQERIGHGGRAFSLLKLRTMKVDNDPSRHRERLKSLINSEAPMTKLDVTADPRLIPGARLIRKLCLDELPQFVNVLRGEMSLVGPRPCLSYEVEEFRRWHDRRFDVLPGMTGLWQVSGKNNLTFAQMIRLDIRYVQSMSLPLDLLILLVTLPAIAAYVIQALVSRGVESRAAEPPAEKRDGRMFSCPGPAGNDWRVDA